MQAGGSPYSQLQQLEAAYGRGAAAAWQQSFVPPAPQQLGNAYFGAVQQAQLLSKASDESASSVFFEEAFSAALMGGVRAPTAMEMDGDMAGGGQHVRTAQREAAAAASNVDPARVASMLDQLALQQPLFMSSKYVKLADLNRGASGFVQLAQNQETRERVAIKFIPRGEHSKAVLCRELLHLSECGQHPNIVQLKEVFLTPHHLGIAMEYVDGGDLAQWVQMHRIPDRGLPEGDARWLFQQIALAVDFCHRLGIALRDIKLDNCLIDATRGAPLVKLCDFGYSKAENLGSGCKTACGTPEYMAPEVLTEARYRGNAADVWSLGVMLYVMIEGQFPFRPKRQRYQMQKLIGRIVNAEYKRCTHASMACQNLLAQMLLPSPEQRITVAEILRHPWFLRDLPPGTELVNERLQHDVHARVSEQTRNEIRHVVDLCNDHAPIRQVRTSQPSQQQAAQQPQPTRHQAQHPQHHPQQHHQGRQPQLMPQAQPTQQQVQQHQQVAAAAAAAASAQRAHAQNQAHFHSPDMQRLLAFGQRESPQQGYRIASA